MKNRWRHLGAAAALACAAVALLTMVMHDSMIYFPSRASEPESVRRAAALGLSPWRDSEGRIVGWQRPDPRASARLVVFHGNAGSALDRAPYVGAFAALGWEVSIFEYPGYGARAGRPGKDAFIRTGRSAVAEMMRADPRPLTLLGESIGAGAASALLETEAGLAGAILVVPFARLIDVAWSHYGPLAFLLRDRWDNLAALKAARVPVAFVVATEDEVIGAPQGRKLHESYAGPKLLMELPGSSHNGFPLGPEVEWVRAVDAFLRGHQVSRASPGGSSDRSPL
ncbi:MAG TPA: alpha/beta hydrolase [Candidatus Eisenbacteria bacterium]|nr:alpha/beta hydrolase [Candidatus Eisenbacteria bacterium]